MQEPIKIVETIFDEQFVRKQVSILLPKQRYCIKAEETNASAREIPALTHEGNSNFVSVFTLYMRKELQTNVLLQFCTSRVVKKMSLSLKAMRQFICVRIVIFYPCTVYRFCESSSKDGLEPTSFLRMIEQICICACSPVIRLKGDKRT